MQRDKSLLNERYLPLSINIHLAMDTCVCFHLNNVTHWHFYAHTPRITNSTQPTTKKNAQKRRDDRVTTSPKHFYYTILFVRIMRLGLAHPYRKIVAKYNKNRNHNHSAIPKLAGYYYFVVKKG